MYGGGDVHRCTVRLSPRLINFLCEDMQGWGLEPLLYAPMPSLPLPSLPVPFSILTTACLSSRAPTPLVPSKTSLSCQAWGKAGRPPSSMGWAPCFSGQLYLTVQPTHSPVQLCHCTGGTRGPRVT